MRVKNRKTIWNLSLKSFRASGKRNLIAVVRTDYGSLYLSFHHCDVVK